MSELDAEAVKSQIRQAFDHVKFPGDWCLRGSNEGDEPYLLEQEFASKTDWRSLDTKFIDQAPDGYGSALSFFSDEAFHFYLPAYLIADIDDKLEQHDPVFHLTHGLGDRDRSSKVNPLRYGERTWFDAQRHQFAMFNKQEAAAIVAFLRFKHQIDEYSRPQIEQALRNYWEARAG